MHLKKCIETTVRRLISYDQGSKSDCGMSHTDFLLMYVVISRVRNAKAICDGIELLSILAFSAGPCLKPEDTLPKSYLDFSLRPRKLKM